MESLFDRHDDPDRRRQLARGKLRYFAVVYGRGGWALDYYPNEKIRYSREVKSDKGTIVGDFETAAEALEAVVKFFKSRHAQCRTTS